ncbi:unnamed protein product [Phaedon cochleariae]|uniref:Putative ionotropic receptor ligand binding domain-containing protein n=1 Tax=Phaedon cochleariae TaxID=80249 RepID=A0A9N9WX34_PHACE|nr:unnamed protein product [Phaedon cochleariae]
MLIYITFALQFFVMCDTKLEPLPRNQINIRRSLSQCIATTSKRYFDEEFEIITISLPLMETNISSPISLDQLTLPELSNLDKATMMIIRLTSLNKTWGKIKTIIMQFWNKKEMLEHLTKLKENNLLNSYGKYLLVSTVAFSKPFHLAKMVSKYMWTENVINFVVMIPNPTNTTQFIVYTWNPYNNNCGNKFSENTHSIDYCFFGTTRSGADWFGDKIPRKLSNCSVNATYLNFPPYVVAGKNKLSGIEINILELIGDQLNVALSIYEAMGMYKQNVSERHNVGSALEILKRNNADLLFGGIPKVSKISQLLLTSRSYMQDTFIWCVPDELLRNNLKNFISSIISFEVIGLTLLLHFITSFLIWYSSNKTDREIASYKNFLEVYVNVYGVIAGSSVPKQPQTIKVRYFLAIFLLFSFFMNSFYNSILTTNIARPQNKRKYTNMKDIYDNNLDTYFIPEQKMFFNADIYAVPLSEIMRKWRDCIDVNLCLKHVCVDMDSSICLSSLYKNFILGNHTLESIYCLKEDGISYPVTMVVKDGFPFYHRFDEILNKLITSGFIAKWEADFIDDLNIPQHQKTAKINLTHLLPAFEIHFIVLTAAFVVFILEIIWYNLVNKCGWIEKRISNLMDI